MNEPLTLAADDQQTLLQLAKSSIQEGLKHGSSLVVDTTQLPDPLCKQRASFVTLEKKGQLRGCIGSLEATRPLGEDVAKHAYEAAFHDPRFPGLQENELGDLEIHLSILTTPEPMTVESEEDLLEQLRPGVDGIILQTGKHRATFLPSVWDSVDGPRDFLRHLKIKAGIDEDTWPPDMIVKRYTVESIH